MTNQNDPVIQIKKAETDAVENAKKAQKDFDEQLKKYEEELKEKTAKFEEELRKKGTEKLQNAKVEASEIFKSKMATEESKKNQIIGEAKAKQGSATKEIIQTFLEHVKT